MIDEQKLDDLLVEWEERRQKGRESSAEEICQSFPELLAELKSRIKRLKSTDWLFDEDADDDSGELATAGLLAQLANRELALRSISYDACVRSLKDTGLISTNELQRLESESPASDGSALLRQLVAQQKLTRFQAMNIAEGKAKSLVLGNYVLLDKLGAGGMGQVFKAWHRRMDRMVAIKMLSAAINKDPAAIARFEQEVKAAAKLNHRQIVSAYDADQAGGAHFLVMEYVEGSNLSAVVKKRGPLSVTAAINCIAEIARGLEYAHSQGVVHRDIKPNNVLLSMTGRIKILDMGLARVKGSDGFATTAAELTGTGQVMGTVDYMSPEQAQNTKYADARSDIYSLGCTLYFLLIGKSPFSGETVVEKILAHREQPAPSLVDQRPEVPLSLDLLCRKMLAKKPEDRHQSISEVLADLKLCREAPVTSPQPTLPEAGFDQAEIPTLRAITTVNDLPAVTPVRASRRKRGTSSFGGRFTRKAVLIGSAFFGFVLLLAAVIITIKSGDSTVTVEVEQGKDTVVHVVTDAKAEVSKLRQRFDEQCSKAKEQIKAEAETKLAELEKRLSDESTQRIATAANRIKAAEQRIEAAQIGRAELERQIAEAEKKQIVAGQQMPPADKGAEKPQVVPGANGVPNLAAGVVRVIATIKKLGGKVELNADSTDVVSVDLSGSRATDATMLQLKALSALKFLDISNTRIGNSGLLRLASLPKLETVNVFACPVTEVGIAALQKKAPGLNITQVASPAVQEAAMEVIRQVGGRISMTDRKVTEIDLRNDETTPCRATDETLLVLPAFPDLELLSLEYLNISNAGLAPLRHLKKLRSLNLSESEDHAITDEGIEHIKGLTNLESLDLEGAVITDAGLRQLASLTKLREFWLFGRFTDAGMATLEKLSALESLWLYCPNLTDAGLRHIKAHKLKLLEIASWDGRPLAFTNQALLTIGGITTLEELNFRDAPQVNDAGLFHLKNLDTLKTLQCERTGITLQGVESLKRSLPKLETIKP